MTYNLTMRTGTWFAILDLAERQGVVTPADVRALGLVPENLNKMAANGLLVRSGRGIYLHPDYEITENHSYVEAAKLVDDGILCLLTALRIHGLGVQNPRQVWIAIPANHHPPRGKPILRAVRMAPGPLSLGVEHHHFEGVDVRVTSVEKTIVDCFRLRRLVGHEVPVEALRDALQRRMLDIDAFVLLARHLRCERLIAPYLEAFLV